MPTIGPQEYDLSTLLYVFQVFVHFCDTAFTLLKCSSISLTRSQVALLCSLSVVFTVQQLSHFGLSLLSCHELKDIWRVTLTISVHCVRLPLPCASNAFEFTVNLGHFELTVAFIASLLFMILSGSDIYIYIYF